MAFSFRLADISDIPRIMEIIGQAKNQMYREGKQQWDETYPTHEHISCDIKSKNGYVMCLSESIIAYGAVVYSGEPTYSSIQGSWLSDQQYVVLHRLAVTDEMKRQGIATLFIEEVEKLSKKKGVKSFKIDTNHDNFYMQRILEKRAFTYCGEIFFEGDYRMAYEKLI